MKPVFALLVLGLTAESVSSCGLDWTLPQAHFDGVEEHGYVSYWEKIGEANLGDGLVIPVNINFNSHREASSPILGKGWLVALLESHVEPIDENSMNVIMPDGWTFLFLRNGNTETWRGNAGWVGQSQNTIFTITAPCGWRVKFDEGKIQEIDSDTNQTFKYKYNGPEATEVDVDGKTLIRVQNNMGNGATINLGTQNIDVCLAKRPRIEKVINQNLISGFDPSLGELRWTDGKTESFVFDTDNNLDPSLSITSAGQTEGSYVWDTSTRLIKNDGSWKYVIAPGTSPDRYAAIVRAKENGESQLWSEDAQKGEETTASGGIKRVAYYFTSGNLRNKLRKVTQTQGGKEKTEFQATYDEKGGKIRECIGNDISIYSNGQLSKRKYDNKEFDYFYSDNDHVAVSIHQGTLLRTVIFNTRTQTIEHIQ